MATPALPAGCGWHFNRNAGCAFADGRPLPGLAPVVQNMTVALPRGARCLLLGSNGAGKTTLLKILGGKHMVPKVSHHHPVSAEVSAGRH